MKNKIFFLFTLILLFSNCSDNSNNCIAQDEDKVWFFDYMTVGFVKSVAFSPDSKYIVAGGSRLCILETETGNIVKEYTGLGNLLKVAWSHNGKYIAVAGYKGLFIWNTANYEMRTIFESDKFDASDIAFSADDRYIAAGLRYTFDGVKIWDVESGNLFKIINYEAKYHDAPQLWISRVNYSNDGKYLSVAGGGLDNNDNYLYVAELYDAKTYEQFSDSIFAVEITNNSQKYIDIDRSLNYIYIRKLPSGEIYKKLSLIIGNDIGIKFSPNDEYLVMSELEDWKFSIWDIEKEKRIYTYTTKPSIHSINMDISKNNKFIIIGDDDGVMLFHTKWGGLPCKEEITNNLNIIRTYPNPTTGDIQIEFSISSLSQTRLYITDVNGNETTNIFDGSLEPGIYTKSWPVRNVSSGSYFVNLKVGESYDIENVIIT